MSRPANRTACPQCGASVRLGADFCGQCYADFRPPTPQPSAPLVPAPTAAYGVPAADPLTAPLLEVLLPVSAPVEAEAPRPAGPQQPPTWPCSRCAAPNEMSAAACATCGAQFLQTVAEESRVTLVLPVVGDLGRYSRGQRLGLALGAVAAVLVPLALLTLLLTGKPPASPAPTGTTVTTPGSPTGN